MATASGADAPHMTFKDLPLCEVVSHMSSVGMDRRLSMKTRLLLRIHTMRCKQCRSVAQQFRVLRRAAQRFDREGIPGKHNTLDRRAAERMNAILRSQPANKKTGN